MQAGEHTAVMERLYGAGRTTVPGMLVDGEPVHGSRAILARLEELAPDPPLYPEPITHTVREAERWGDEELQDLGRRLPWGAMHFRPEAPGTFGGSGPLDPPGTDFAIRYVRASWKYHAISAERLAADLARLPAKLDHVDALVAEGVLGGELPTAADLQIGATLRVLLTIADLQDPARAAAGRPRDRLRAPPRPGHPARPALALQERPRGRGRPRLRRPRRADRGRRARRAGRRSGRRAAHGAAVPRPRNVAVSAAAAKSAPVRARSSATTRS